MAEVK